MTGQYQRYVEKLDAHDGDPANPICIGCAKTGDELESMYGFHREHPGQSIEEIIAREEGTFNDENGHFACDICYIKMGQPLRKDGKRWVAP